MLKRFLADESGLETVEYAIITGLVVAAAIVAIGSIGDRVGTIFENLDGQMATAGADPVGS